MSTLTALKREINATSRRSTLPILFEQLGDLTEFERNIWVERDGRWRLRPQFSLIVVDNQIVGYVQTMTDGRFVYTRGGQLVESQAIGLESPWFTPMDVVMVFGASARLMLKGFTVVLGRVGSRRGSLAATAKAQRTLNTLTSSARSFGNRSGGFSTSAAAGILKLPAAQRKMVIEALRLKRINNPRLLAKHPGPIKPQDLSQELLKKGFVHVKKAANDPYRGIYLRKVRGHNGRDMYEAVRIDTLQSVPKVGQTASKGSNVVGDKGLRQGAERTPRRQHHLLNDGKNPKPHGIAEDIHNRKLRKGAYSHWHHERFPASADAVKRYLTAQGEPPVIQGLEKLDPVGQIVTVTK